MTTTSNRELPATEALIVSLDEYIRARYGLLAVQTFEEERFVRFMRGVADHERHRAKGLYLWSRTRGLAACRRTWSWRRTAADSESRGRAVAYRVHRGSRAGSVRAQLTFAPYLLEYGAPKPELVRRLRELAWAIRSRPVTVIFLGARFPEIPELEKEVKVLDLPLPEEAETSEILDSRSRTAARPTRTPAWTWIPTHAATSFRHCSASR